MLFANATDPLPIGNIGMYMAGGLALFLFGMDQMAEALKLLAGDGMRKLLARLTTNRFTGLLAGTVVTAIIQSSSVTTVLVVSFISAGLMSMSQSISIIIGANIGSTVTTQIIAFNVTQYSLLLIALGFVLFFCFGNEKTQQYGKMIMGLGLIFFGMQLMSDGTRPLRTYAPFIDLMQRMDSPLLGIAVAALFTAIIQSSAATMGVVIVFASQGVITLEAGIALALGANIGTCVTVVLAAFGKPREAVRAAVVQVLFNVLGVAIWFGFVDQLATLVVWMSPTAAKLPEAARAAAETPRQIANAHTVFNVANALLFIWLTTPLAWLVRHLVPDRQEQEPEPAHPRHLDEILLETPAFAIDIVRMELGRLGASALRMVRGALSIVVTGDQKDLETLESMDDDVDQLHAAIIAYIRRLSQEHLSQGQSKRLHGYLSAANYIENIGDMIETNLVATGLERIKRDLQISKTTRQVLQAFHEKVCENVEQAIQALVGSDGTLARKVIDAKAEVQHLADEADEHLLRRLTADEPQRLEAFRLESEIIEYLKRMHYFAKRIAKLVTELELSVVQEDSAESAEKTGVT